MRLTAKENPETIKRYEHIRPARGWRTVICSVKCPGTPHTCTLTRAHRGPHVAHGTFRKVVAVWHEDTADQAFRGAVRQASKARARRGFQSTAPIRILRSLGHVVRTISSVEDIAMVLLLLGALGFAIQVFILMLG